LDKYKNEALLSIMAAKTSDNPASVGSRKLEVLALAAEIQKLKDELLNESSLPPKLPSKTASTSMTSTMYRFILTFITLSL